MERYYINAKELMKLTGFSYRSSLDVIEKAIIIMKERNYYIPNCKNKLALKTIVAEYLGIDL